MKIKKLVIGICSIGMIVTVFKSDVKQISANDFSNTDYWLEKCSVAQENATEAQKCREFKSYYASLTDKKEDEIGKLNSEVSKIKDNVDQIEKGVKDIQVVIDDLQSKINTQQRNIDKIHTEMIQLDIKIKAIKKDIDLRDKVVKDRMMNEQVNMGTNMQLEMIMGSSDLIDMIRKIEGLQKITESDQKDIKKLLKDKEKLDLQKKEQQRLETDAKEKQAEIQKKKETAEKMKKEQERLVNAYRLKEAELNEKMRSAKADISTIRNNMININTSVMDNIKDENFTSGDLLRPVRSGVKSAGTWYYPGGGVHLGLDYAAPIGTPVVAPADGIVLYASNPYSSNNGFLGNYIGHPSGAGNSIHYLTQVSGTTYAISMFHLAQEGFIASPGAKFKQGEVIARTGNSGNTSGPHCHMEVINLGNMSMSDAIQRFNASSADFAWGTGWGNSALGRTCSVSGAPCRERPEEVFR